MQYGGSAVEEQGVLLTAIFSLPYLYRFSRLRLVSSKGRFITQRKVDTIYVELPGSYHNMAARPSQLITKVDHILAWMERYR